MSSSTRFLLAELSYSLVPSHFDIRSSLASLPTSNPLLSLLEHAVEVVMDQFLLSLITTRGIHCVFSPNREVTLIGRPQTQCS
jgi:hypothetical protein